MLILDIALRLYECELYECCFLIVVARKLGIYWQVDQVEWMEMDLLNECKRLLPQARLQIWVFALLMPVAELIASFQKSFVGCGWYSSLIFHPIYYLPFSYNFCHHSKRYTAIQDLIHNGIPRGQYLWVLVQ